MTDDEIWRRMAVIEGKHEPWNRMIPQSPRSGLMKDYGGRYNPDSGWNPLTDGNVLVGLLQREKHLTIEREGEGWHMCLWFETSDPSIGWDNVSADGDDFARTFLTAIIERADHLAIIASKEEG